MKVSTKVILNELVQHYSIMADCQSDVVLAVEMLINSYQEKISFLFVAMGEVQQMQNILSVS